MNEEVPMKSTSTTSTSTRTRSQPVPESAAGADSYVSLAQTRFLLADSLAARMKRLDAEDMVNTDAAAELAGTTRVTINAWIAKGRAIGLTQTRRGFRLPVWQFEPVFWEAVPKLSKALGVTEGWALLHFLETPQGALEGQTPRQAIEQGRLTQVLELAQAEGT